jgi:hypothetical protein
LIRLNNRTYHASTWNAPAGNIPRLGAGVATTLSVEAFGKLGFTSGLAQTGQLFSVL